MTHVRPVGAHLRRKTVHSACSSEGVVARVPAGAATCVRAEGGLCRGLAAVLAPDSTHSVCHVRGARPARGGRSVALALAPSVPPAPGPVLVTASSDPHAPPQAPPCRPSPAPTWANPSPYMGCSHPGSHLPTPPLPSHIRSARTRARARSSPRGPLSAASPCCAAPPAPPFIFHASPSFPVCPVPFLLPWWGLPWQLQRTCQGRHRRQHARGL